MLEKIFKSNMVMGGVAIATLILVGLMYWRVQKANQNCKDAIKKGADVNPNGEE